MLGPDASAGDVEGVDQRLDVAVGEAPTEVAGGGRVGDATRAQGIEKVFVGAAEFDVLQTGAVAEGVVGEVEDVVGFVVGEVDFEQVEVAIDVVDESDASGQEMDGTDAAADESIGFVRDFVVDVAGGELRFGGGRVFRFVEGVSVK